MIDSMYNLMEEGIAHGFRGVGLHQLDDTIIQIHTAMIVPARYPFDLENLIKDDDFSGPP